jgi:hypothetical protein
MVGAHLTQVNHAIALLEKLSIREVKANAGQAGVLGKD